MFNYKFYLTLCLYINALFFSTNLLADNANPPSELRLAQYWAPTLYHDTDKGYDYLAEYITKVNYDGDWDTTNNWENIYKYPLTAHIYYDVVESKSHWFIQYHAYHPRDDGPIGDRHENDFEGAIFSIRKVINNPYGELEAIITLAHDRFYKYSNLESLSNQRDGEILFDENAKPMLYIQANGFTFFNKGHGWYNYEKQNAIDGDGIIYYYGGESEQPKQADGNFIYRYSYDLLPLEQLWQRRMDKQVFSEFGIMRGDTYKKNSAKMPWYWNDPTDGPIYNGAMYADPAYLFTRQFSNYPNLSTEYIENNNYTHTVKFNKISTLFNQDLLNKRNELYIKLWINGILYWDQKIFIKKQAISRQQYAVEVTEQQKTLYIAQAANSKIRIAVFDQDPIKDDFLGDITFTLKPGEKRQRTEFTNTRQALVSYDIEAF